MSAVIPLVGNFARPESNTLGQFRSGNANSV